MKKCSNCCYIRIEKNAPMVGGVSYFCDILNEIIYSTRLLTLKLEWLDRFYCNFFEEKK
jgi:hypothetical protein